MIVVKQGGRAIGRSASSPGLNRRPAGSPYDAATSRRPIRDTWRFRWRTRTRLRSARRRALPSRTRVFKAPPRVLFDNKASVTHTVIEVNGRDRLGFLHDVTAALTGLGLQIGSAHISTYGHRVVDVFYVKDSFGLKIGSDQKLERIEEQLLAAISGREVAAPAPAEAPVPA